VIELPILSFQPATEDDFYTQPQPCPDLREKLDGLGLNQYLTALVNNGFDSWEGILNINEDDFNQLNMKRGHRRKLQQKIRAFQNSSKKHKPPPSAIVPVPTSKKRRNDAEHERTRKQCIGTIENDIFGRFNRSDPSTEIDPTALVLTEFGSSAKCINDEWLNTFLKNEITTAQGRRILDKALPEDTINSICLDSTVEAPMASDSSTPKSFTIDLSISRPESYSTIHSTQVNHIPSDGLNTHHLVSLHTQEKEHKVKQSKFQSSTPDSGEFDASSQITQARSELHPKKSEF
jgi:hypothetical protein